MTLSCDFRRSWKPKLKPNLGFHSSTSIIMPAMLVFVPSWWNGGASSIYVSPDFGLWPRKIFFRYVPPGKLITIFALLPKKMALKIALRATISLTWIERAIFKVATLWRHWWCNRGQNGFILRYLPSAIHMWSEIEAIVCKTLILKISEDGFDFWPLTIYLNRNGNRKSNMLEICPACHRLWHYLFPRWTL